MITVYQAEWCPHSHKIRQRLTELQIPFVAVPVSTVREDRAELLEATGQNSIPAVILDDGTVLVGKDRIILDGINSRYPEDRDQAKAHKQKDLKNYPFKNKR